MIETMAERLMARTREVPSRTVPVEKIDSPSMKLILQKLGITEVYAVLGYRNRGAVTMVNFDEFPWETAELELSNAEGIVRCLSSNGCGLPFSARMAESGYELKISPPSVYRCDLEMVLPRLPEGIKEKINDALQNELKYRKPFMGMI